MIRWLFLVVAAPLWLPWRILRALLALRSARPVVQLKLEGALPDLPERSGLMSMLRPPRGGHLLGVLETLSLVERCETTRTLLVVIQDLECGLGRAEELRAALSRVKASGKRVIVYAEELGLAGYWVAQGASSVHLPTTGSLNVSGVGMEITLLGGLLDRAGVRAQLRALGKYKSMRETFTERRASDANREMMQSLVDDLGQQAAETVAACRGGDGPSVAATIDQGPFRADEALQAGLVDKLEYFDELWTELGGETGKVQSAAHFVRQQRGRRILPAPRPAQVALVRVSGNIRSGHDRFGRHGKRATGSLSLARTVRRARRSKSIKAIVLRIDSPGGSALASDLMWRELTLAAKDKPLFVSMVNVAASGGYYASGVKGATVWTNPTTLTGSIGVVAGKFEISGLLDKLDIFRQAVGSGPRASYHSISNAWGAPELEKLDRDLDAHYRVFVTKMADARGMTYDALHALAQGRVWTGKQAHERGLVDHLGGLHEVITCLRETLKLPDQSLLRWSILAPAAGLRALLSPDSEHDDEGLRAVSALLPRVDELAGGWLEIATDLGSERLLALSPLGGWRNRR